LHRPNHYSANEFILIILVAQSYASTQLNTRSR
jgi:hypothetical protein